MTDYKLSNLDLDKFYDLYLYAFNRTDSKKRRDFFETRYENSIPYGYGDKRLMSGLLRIPFVSNFKEVRYRTDGIADVMSLPENMSGISANVLLRNALKDMYDSDAELSYLAPFSFEYYRKFGYEYAFDNYSYTIAVDDLPKVPMIRNGELLRTTVNDDLKKFYAKKTSSEIGGLDRPDWWWDYLVKKHPDRELIEYLGDSKEISGYLMYSRDNEKFRIEEFIYDSSDAFNALMKFVTRHASSHKIFQYDSPIPVNNLSMFPNPNKIDLKIKPYMMARIVNLEKFVKKYPFKKNDFILIIRVKDDVISENNRMWELNSNKFSPTEKFETDVEIDIRELTQVFMGKAKAIDLYHIGKVTGSLEAIKRLDSIVIDKQGILRDYF